MLFQVPERHETLRGEPPWLKEHGWLILDKPEGLSSNAALARLKRYLPFCLTESGKKTRLRIGYAGTLDPLATGCLPIALGEATKTVEMLMDAQKTYHFGVRWGIQTTTDDLEGTPLTYADHRPSLAEIEAILPSFHGPQQQTPPPFSAIKIGGQRAYARARAGESVQLQPRLIHITRLTLQAQPDAETAFFEVICGKGTYVRALARDLGLRLGSRAHVISLRRVRVGPFAEQDLRSLDEISLLGEKTQSLSAALLPLEAALPHLPKLELSLEQAYALRDGRPLPFPFSLSQSTLPSGEAIFVQHKQIPIALCHSNGICLKARRVFVFHPLTPAPLRDSSS